MGWFRKLPAQERQLQADLRDRLFWVRFLAAGVDLSGCDSLENDRLVADRRRSIERVCLEFPQGFKLLVSVGSWGHEIFLDHPQLPSPATLGWMDSHQMSDVFRRSEFETLVRCLESANTFDNVNWAPRLLLAFYVSPLREYQDWYLAMMRSAAIASGLFRENEASWIVQYTSTILRDDFRWTFDEKTGWLASGSDSYSLRSIEQDQFPFTALRNLLDVADA